LAGLGGENLDAQGGATQRPDGHTVLQRPRRAVSQRRAGADLAAGALAAQFGAELFRRANDQRLELVDDTGAGGHRALAGGQQHPQRLAVATATGASG
jgi:hypothetical protein